MPDVLKIYNKLEKYPFGKMLFSWAVCWWTPYFSTIKPKVVELRSGYCEAKMPKRHRITNHIKTVHAIAMCNLSEFVAGLGIEVSIPKHLRWIPVGMEVKYLKKGTTDLTASCSIAVADWDAVGDLAIPVSVKDQTGLEVFTAVISMRVTPKPKR